MTDLVKAQDGSANLAPFANSSSFKEFWQMAGALAGSTLVPKDYRNNVPNCMIALEISSRTGSSLLMVMQNLYSVHGRPSWSAQYTIGAINSCGRFKPLQFEMSGEENTDSWGCRAFSYTAGGTRVDGPLVTVRMAKDEGWYHRKDKNGGCASKWPTMTELMLRYRSASFFGRLHAPDVLMGFQTEDEVIDITPVDDDVATSKLVAPIENNSTVNTDGTPPDAPKSEPNGDQKKQPKKTKTKSQNLNDKDQRIEEISASLSFGFSSRCLS